MLWQCDVGSPTERSTLRVKSSFQNKHNLSLSPPTNNPSHSPSIFDLNWHPTLCHRIFPSSTICCFYFVLAVTDRNWPPSLFSRKNQLKHFTFSHMCYVRKSFFHVGYTSQSSLEPPPWPQKVGFVKIQLLFFHMSVYLSVCPCPSMKTKPMDQFSRNLASWPKLYFIS